MEVPNIQMVGVQGDSILVMMPKSKMTKQEALVHAAWLVALADSTDDKFQGILEEVWSL